MIIGLVIVILLLFVPAIAIYYVIAAMIGHFIPAKGRINHTETPEITIYILTNGMHTDFILPLKNKIFDWTAYLPDQFEKNPAASWVGIGWGDKGFYLDTPEWKKLKASVAARALFGFSHTLMHITFHETMKESEQCTSFRISTTQYQVLINYIRSYFQEDANGQPLIVAERGYTPQDEFYEAYKKYTLFKTCNVWTNQGIKKMGFQTSIWAPFERTVMYNSRKIKEAQSNK